MGTLVKVFKGFPNLGFYARISTSASILNRSNEIKRPASPFAIFFQEKSKNLKMENPELSQREIMKLASELWKSSASFEQQRYRDLYEDRMHAYKQDLKVPPKRPVNPYIRFYMDNNDSLSVIYPNILDRSKKTSEMWQNLSDFEKSRYRMDYDKELSKFKENLTEEDKIAMQNRKEALNTRREKQNIRKYGKEAWRERPKMISLNSYTEYVREQTPNVPKGENTFKYLSQTWKQLSEAEKLKYREIALKHAENEREKLSEWEEKNKLM